MLGKTVVILALVVLGECGDANEKCGDVGCVEKELVDLVDGLDQKEEIPILGDAVVLERVNGSRGTGRSDEDLLSRLVRYLEEHELKVKVPERYLGSRSLQEEGRKRKFRKFLLPLLLLGKLKAAVEIPAILTIVSLIAFKGVGVGLVALILASVALFKAFANGHLQTSSKLSYEIVPQVAAPALQWSRTAPQAFEPWPTQGYHGIPGIGG